MLNGHKANNFVEAHNSDRPVEDMADEAAEKVADLISEHYERDATDAEKEWARRFVRKMHERGVTPRLPTLAEVQRAHDLGPSPVAMKRMGLPPNGTFGAQTDT